MSPQPFSFINIRYFQIKGRLLDKTSRSTKLSKLYPGTRYLVCVLALGNWVSRSTSDISEEIRHMGTKHHTYNSTHDGWEIFTDAILPVLIDSPTSKCADASTLGPPDIIHGGLGSIPEHTTSVQSILTRRLGLIIGCCMGFVVFIVLVSILGYLKVKKQRAAVKREQPIPPEYISYRHFSIQSGETGAHSGHPHFITNMNTTTLS